MTTQEGQQTAKDNLINATPAQKMRSTRDRVELY